MRRTLGAVLVAGVMAAALLPAGVAAREPTARPSRPVPSAIDGLKLATPIHLANQASKVARILQVARGQQRVIVRLSTAPAAAVASRGATYQRARVASIVRQQNAVIGVARKLDKTTRLLGRTSKASNVVALRIDARQLKALAADPRVVSITPVRDYQMALSETVPYVGATAVQAAGFTGAGVRVAVLDSGIDYTHQEFGGAGTAAAYEAAWGTSLADPRHTTRDGLFPTAKVVGGYDFVGEEWAGSADTETPDPDPIDAPPTNAGLGTDGGHGTHVGDIIAGAKGVAPGAKLYAVKVCSSVSTACSGVALIEGMDFAVDPNGDGSTADHVNVVNMSLGSDYGTAFDDDLSFAVDQASKVGVLTAAASGNGGNKPYISGTPAAAASAISVAQTEVPSALQYPLVVNSPAVIAGTYPNTAVPDWGPVGSGFTGTVAYVGQGCPAGSIDGTNPDDPYLADPAGKVALISRGGCAVSLKVDRAATAGAIAVLIGLVAPGDPFAFSFGGGTTFVPTVVIEQTLSLAIRANIAAPVVVSISSAVSIPLVGGVVGSSSRGPSMENRLKPEIGAPGASVSAVSGSGTGTEAFGGTSGATPMVSGAAALLKDAFPGRSPLEIKAVLMNTAETETYTNKATQPGVLAPITRIGGGELRVDRALKATAAAWNKKDLTGALSFGFVDVTKRLTWVSKELTVRNYSNHRVTYRVSPKLRYANDRANGAVSVFATPFLTLAPHQTRDITVSILIDGRKLNNWLLDSGPNGTNAAALDLLEYDGYVNLDNVATRSDDADPLHVAWQVLPRLSDDVSGPSSAVKVRTPIVDGQFAGLVSGTTTLKNKAVGPAAIDAYSLVATSRNLPPSVRGANAPVIDLKSVGVQTFPVPAGYCSADPSFVYVVAINTWERTTNALAPAEFDVVLDTNRDGTPDYLIFTADASGPGGLSTGQSLTWSYDIANDALDAFFYTDHATNSANTLLTICGEQVGLNASNFFEPMTMDVAAVDWYYTGHVTDEIDGITVAPLGERYVGVFGTDSVISGDIDPFSSTKLTIVDFGPDGTNPTESGLLLVADASRPAYHGAAPLGNDALRVLVKH